VTLEPIIDALPKEALAAVVHAAKGGDQAAFARLYERYARMIHGILLAHVRHQDAEDLVQTVFATALKRLSSLRDSEAVGAWLAAIARNAAFDHHRRRRPEDPLLDVHSAGGPTGNAATTLDAESVLGEIRTLPEAYRETLMLRLVEGMTGPEIAMRTGLTPDSVRVNLSRGMKLLRERLS
jgi:RNA polymerase sigma-70 factor, ECF subfamily